MQAVAKPLRLLRLDCKGPMQFVQRANAGPYALLAVLATGCGGDVMARDEPRGNQLGPVGEGRGVRVFTGHAATLEPIEACTAAELSGSERWCGFVALSSAGMRNLYVVNVSRVIAGVPVSCDVLDPNCLLLTEDVAGSGANWHATFFKGDTLVYYDATLTPHAWRPGWERGRLLAARPDLVDLVFCTPAARGTAVACLALPYEQPDLTIRVGELYVGRADGESEPLLAPFDHVITTSRGDQDGVQRFSFGFPVDGYVAWTTREEPGGPEVLKLQHLDDPESRIAVASDVHDWDVSADGSHWFWLSGFDSSRKGSLQVAPFPGGEDPIDLLADVADYGLHENASVVALTADSALVSLPDPIRKPHQQLLLDQPMEELVELGDHGHIAYARTIARGNVADLFISRLDGTLACAIEETVSVPLNSVHFSSGPKAALWARAEAVGYDAYATRLADCSSTLVASDVTALGWIGETIVFMNGYDAENATGTMHFRRVRKSGEVDASDASLVAEHVGSYAGAGNALMYTVNAHEDEGVYVRAFAPAQLPPR